MVVHISGKSNPMTKKFRTHVAELRKKHNVSRMDLVRKADMTYPTVVSWENEALASANANTIWLLMQLFNCTIDELLYFVDEDSKE
jgi:DNA-binding XRE family transcriptional regulator